MISFALYMQSNTSASELVAECRRLVAELPTGVPSPAVSGGATDALRSKIIQDGYGLTPNTAIALDVEIRNEESAQIHALLGASLKLIHSHPGDAVLLFNGEVPYFARRNGSLIINARQGMWDPERVALIPGPFTSEEIADL